VRNIQRNRKRKSLPLRVINAIFGRPSVIIILLIIALIAVIVGVAVFANSCSANKSNPEVISVTGAADAGTQGQTSTDNTSTAGSQTGDTPTTTPATTTPTSEDAAQYGPFELQVSVKGNASWLEITIDGKKVVAQSAADGYSEKFTVTKTAEVIAGAPSNVTVKRNDKTQKLKLANGVGSLTLKVKKAPSTSGTSASSSATTGSTTTDNSAADIPDAADITGR
jgi:hypothetical protein